MPISENFQFSQASLQDAVECRRRFQLRYLLELAWPAPAAEPADAYEAHVRDGEAFHRLIHQHQLGLPVERLTAQANAEDEGRLATWWANYLAAAPADLPGQRYPEYSLSAPLAGHRLIAKYDLIAVEPGRRAVIVDWKTSQHRPSSAWLAARLQTRVYRYLLAAAGAALNGGQPLAAEQIEMIYWFAEHPDRPERLRYNRTQYEADGRYLASLIAEIAQARDDDFPLTDDVTRCRFCSYRSLCDRGVAAGDMGAEDDEATTVEETPPVDWAAGFDFEQVGEVEF